MRADDPIVLDDGEGLSASVLAWGATLQRLLVPDRLGRRTDVVLGFDDPAAYRRPHPYFGNTVGRCANRIAFGRCVLDGATIHLAPNDGPHHLHGGARGCHQQSWDVVERSARAVTLAWRSPHGDEGYPGTVEATVTYALADRALHVTHEAGTDRPTIVNFAHHSYWNLLDGGASDVRPHRLTLAADAYLPVDAASIPIGTIAPVDGTAFDFRAGPSLGAALQRLVSDRGGFDHHFVTRTPPGTVRWMGRLDDPVSGRCMDVWSDAPGLQVYTGNVLDGSLRGKGGALYGRHAGVCLETQGCPNAPNVPAFPSVVLRPGARYRHRVSFRFGTGADGAAGNDPDGLRPPVASGKLAAS